jgi:hypothetical protein
VVAAEGGTKHAKPAARLRVAFPPYNGQTNRVVEELDSRATVNLTP